jgi:hypothetical protein
VTPDTTTLGLLAATQILLNWIVKLANSGDVGFLGPETMDEAKQARAAIARAGAA